MVWNFTKPDLIKPVVPKELTAKDFQVGDKVRHKMFNTIGTVTNNNYIDGQGDAALSVNFIGGLRGGHSVTNGYLFGPRWKRFNQDFSDLEIIK